MTKKDISAQCKPALSGKRALVFSTAYHPFVGGAEVAVKEITDRISDIEFFMITARMNRQQAKKEKIGNITVYRIGIGRPFFDKYFLAFWGYKIAEKLHKRNKFDLIWSMMASYGGFAGMFFKKRNRKVPFLLTLQEGDDLEYINRRVRFMKRFFKEIFTQADFIQCISRCLADWARKMGAKCEIQIVPNGVDIKNFSRNYSGEELNDLKNKLGKKENDIFMIHTGRLTKKNGLEYVIRSLELLPENIKFLSVGSGELKDELTSLARELSLENRVIFVDYVDHKELPKYLKISDIFIRPSLSEGLGNSFLEAMVAGLPVIAAPVGGIPDFLADRETGFFCEVHSPESISNVVEYIIDEKNKDKIEEVKKRAKEMVEEKYNWNIVSKKMKNIFDKII